MPNPDAVYDVLVREAGAVECKIRRVAFKVHTSRGGTYYVLPWGMIYGTDTNRVTDPSGRAQTQDTVARTNAALAALEGGDD